MGQFDDDVTGSDEVMDIMYLYFERYNAGQSPAEIYEWFKKERAFLFDRAITADCTGLWLGLALCQWEVKALEPFVYERVKEIVEQDVEREQWAEHYAGRKKHLQKFLEKIGKEKKTAKKPVKQKLFRAAFEKGDVITYPIYDLEAGAFTGTWGLAVCIAHSAGLQESAHSLFMQSGVEKNGPATMEDFASAHALAGHADNRGITCKTMYRGVDMAPMSKIVKAGRVEVGRSFCLDSYASNLSWFFSYAYNFEKGGPHNTVFKMPDAIGIPDSPYSKWAEKIVALQCLRYDDPAKNDPETYRSIAAFLIDLYSENEQVFRQELIPFVADYLYTPVNEVMFILTSIIRDAGHSIDKLE